MRDFKFRCWDEKKMHYDGFAVMCHTKYKIMHRIIPDKETRSYVSKSIVFDEKFTNSAFIAVGENSFDDMTDEKIIIMQYTGLRDINGIEIYEGDIVNEVYQSTTKTFDEGIEIKFGNYDNKLGFGDFDYGFGFYYIQFGNPNSFKDSLRFLIVGNIYENPELLSN